MPFTGPQLDKDWTSRTPGSASSILNFLPFEGVLIPRSRLSSLNSIRDVPSITGMTGLIRADTNPPNIWISGSTLHAMVHSNGSISRASFVSAGGIGVAGLSAGGSPWIYTQTFSGNLNENMLVAAGTSSQTLVVLYNTAGGAAAAPLYSFLTSAPRARAVASYDNYILAFNINGACSRVQWCVRGNPSNWTSEGSGFEDLLDMRGQGIAVRGTSDGRFVLFSELEIWYGVSATYPAQFQFAALDTTVGCLAAATVVDTEFGLFFQGSDYALRVLPKGGGQSQIVAPGLAKAIRNDVAVGIPNASFGIYDAPTGMYHLHVNARDGSFKPLVINVRTGEWSFTEYNSIAPTAGTALKARTNFVGNEGLFFANSTGTVFSTSSLISQEQGSNVTSRWRSNVIAADLAGDYKQLTKAALDYVATSKSTVTIKVSQDGGNNYESPGQVMSLVSAPVSGRVEKDLYLGGPFPTIELISQSTGFELHRLDVTMNIGGRK